MEGKVNARTTIAVLAAVWAVAAAGAPVVRAGVLTPVTFADDATSGVSPDLTYTHLADLTSDDGGAVINGVTFPAATNAGAGGGGTVSTFNLTAPSVFQNFNSPAPDGGGLDDLLDDFYHSGGIGNGSASLTLTGLTPGVPYRLRLYVGGFGGNLQTFTADDTSPATTFAGIPRNAGSDVLPGSIDYTYTLGPGDTDFVMMTTPATANDSFHWYGFSNEVVPEPTSLSLAAGAAAGLLVRRRRPSAVGRSGRR